MESHLVQVVCVHIRGVSAIQRAGLEEFHCIGMSNCNVCSCNTLAGTGLETPEFKKEKKKYTCMAVVYSGTSAIRHPVSSTIVSD